ncbi:cleft lip and palate transmembrane protein 1-like protein [Cheilinus undulatus]|uniref:cleft lip and palate transmembrane protein 1-like protein n=1 Tax=Cheilinus undulatus TaxID=241271 RepID=UPI001BD40C4A|nr:cleft lip and palate transmembrane protein 1-like protein [Cheilinus undulatus]
MLLKKFFTILIKGLFVMYVLHIICSVIVKLMQIKPCNSTEVESCITPFLAQNPKLQLSIYTALQPNAEGGLTLIHKEDNFDVNSKFERIVNVSLPETTRNNGTLYALIFVHQAGLTPWQDLLQVHRVAQLTTYMVPEISVRSGKDQTKSDQPICHWHSRLTVNIVQDHFLFDQNHVPRDVRKYLKIFRINDKMVYLPLLFVDELRNRIKDLVEISSISMELPLTISYDSISLGKMRFWNILQVFAHHMQQSNFTAKTVDEFKGFFVDTSLYFVALFLLVAAFHIIFDFLAFKNDVSFWRQKKSMVGMSRKAVLWRCFSNIVIFYYLSDKHASSFVLIPAGIGCATEIWKVKKVFKIQLIWNEANPTFVYETLDNSEKRTNKYDTLAMKYFIYLQYPLYIGALLYAQPILFKSWDSWMIEHLAKGVHGFGFLFMLPQLFVNYKLKSVAHLSGKVLMYQAFNAFIDTVMAFNITMPASHNPTHRLAFFRDEVLFLMYLCQRWLYPVDRTRVN